MKREDNFCAATIDAGQLVFNCMQFGFEYNVCGFYTPNKTHPDRCRYARTNAAWNGRGLCENPKARKHELKLYVSKMRRFLNTIERRYLTPKKEK